MPTIRGAEKGSKKRYAGMIHKNGINHQPYTDFIKNTHDDLLAGKLDNKLTYTSTQPPQVKAAKKMKKPGRKKI